MSDNLNRYDMKYLKVFGIWHYFDIIPDGQCFMAYNYFRRSDSGTITKVDCTLEVLEAVAPARLALVDPAKIKLVN